MALDGKWIELFRAGDYGGKGSYTTADIDRMVALYDPAKHEAPLVIGHPEHDAPAFGWLDKVKRVGNVLMGCFKQVQPAFEEMFSKGLFKKRSISFYRTPDGPALRHVGFLGAMPPEVKGLADVKLASFSAGDFQAIEFKEEEMDGEQIGKSITQSLKEFFTELLKGRKVVELNDGENEKAIAAAVKAATEPLTAKFTELETKLKTATEKLAANDVAATTQGQIALAETQMARVKTARRWVPAFDKMGLPQIFTELAKVNTKVKFTEGDKPVEKPAVEAFGDFMIGLREIVPTGELATGTTKKGTLVQFTEPTKKSGAAIDQDSVSLAEAAKALSVKEKIPYGDALRRIRASGDYVHEGGAAAGSV
jgi:hypothetical protein